MKIEGEKAREQVKERFIAEKHLSNLEEVMREHKLAVSFRAAGRETIRQINRNDSIGKKPHSILDKSLKGEELDKLIEKICHETQDFNKSEEEVREFLGGLIPHRDKIPSGKPTGLYICGAGVHYFEEKCKSMDVIRVKIQGDNKYIASSDESIESLVKILFDLNAISGEYYFTGDYDIHDMLENLPRAAIVCTAGPDKDFRYDEYKVLNLLGKGALYGADYLRKMSPEQREKDVKSFIPAENSPIQHGAQYNYIAQMLNYEPEKEIVEKVAGYDLDIAFYNGHTGVWTIMTCENNPDGRLEQADNLSSYYSNLGLTLKYTWKEIDGVQAFLQRN